MVGLDRLAVPVESAVAVDRQPAEIGHVDGMAVAAVRLGLGGRLRRSRLGGFRRQQIEDVVVQLGVVGIADVRIALGSVGVTPIRATAAEAVLRGQPLKADGFAEAGEKAGFGSDLAVWTKSGIALAAKETRNFESRIRFSSNPRDALQRFLFLSLSESLVRA